MTEVNKLTGEESQKSAAQADKTSTNEAASSTPKINKKGASKKDAPQEMTVAEIISAMNAKTEQMNSLSEEIEIFESELTKMKTEKAELEAQVKPVRRMVKKYNPNGAVIISLSAIEKKAARVKIKVLKNQIILKEDMITKKKSAYATYHEATLEQMKTDELRNKAQSYNWTTRNRWSVSARLVKFLNMLLNEHKKDILALAKLSRTKSAGKADPFDAMLEQLLDAYDADTFILCSHLLRKPLYSAMRETLKSWDTRKAPEFKKLILYKKMEIIKSGGLNPSKNLFLTL